MTSPLMMALRLSSEISGRPARYRFACSILVSKMPHPATAMSKQGIRSRSMSAPGQATVQLSGGEGADEREVVRDSHDSCERPTPSDSAVRLARLVPWVCGS